MSTDKIQANMSSSQVEIFRDILSTQYHSNINDNTISIINNCIKPYLPNNKNKLIDLVMISIAYKRPIAQFIIDIYGECVLKYNLTINEFMEKSNFLSMLPNHGKPWQLIRKHLTEYLKNIYYPIYQNIKSDSDGDDEHNKKILIVNGFMRRLNNSSEGIFVPNDIIQLISYWYNNIITQVIKQHNMGTIIYYTSVIHENMFILNNVSQIDIVFVPELLHWLNEKYFKTLGIKYKKLIIDNDNYITQMMKAFNNQLDDTKCNRCIILIMEANDVCNDTVYIFEPLENNSLSPEICNYTEMPWICNTKSYILPSLSVSNSNSLCLSIHRHSQFETERVYLSDGTCNVRVFKHNLKDILRRFSVKNEDDYCIIDWKEEIKNKEFNDYQYRRFVNTYFGDLQLLKGKF